jgi:hypothetical protein
VDSLILLKLKEESMKKMLQKLLRPLFLFMLVCMAATAAGAAPMVYVGEDDLGSGVVTGFYGKDYLFTDTAPGTGWQGVGYDHSAWTVGYTPYGNYGTIAGSFTNTVLTSWPVDVGRYVFKTFPLGQAIPMTAKVAVDNGYDLWINGTWVSGDNAEGYTSHWEYVFTVPASNFTPGVNTLAFFLEDHGGATAWDFSLVGDSNGMVPLPPTVLLLGSGLAGLAGWRRFCKG